MSYRTSRKEIYRIGDVVRYAPYGALQNLLRFESPEAYTSGVYGWNYDVYYVNGIAICTGYRNMPGKRLIGIREYESKARKINNNLDLSYEDKKIQTTQLLKEFCELNK